MASTSTRYFERICVFCGAYPGKDKVFEYTALQVGAFLANLQIQVIYGGGSNGLMGAVAASASAGGTQVLGIIPKVFANVCGPTLGREIRVLTIPERIQTMIFRADAFIALPGGLGTLEEIICVASWSSLLIHKKPIGLLNINGYFNSLLAFLDNAVENGFMFSAVRKIFVSATDIADLLEKLYVFDHQREPVNLQIDGSRKRKRDSDKRELDNSVTRWFRCENKEKLDLTLSL